MRLFISVNFEQDVVEYLSRLQLDIKQYCFSGNFTRADNFHITLVFIGEVDKKDIWLIKDVMDKSASGYSSFNLKLNDIGCFSRRGSKIIWAGVGGELEKLEGLHNHIYQGLYDVMGNFNKHKLKYSPHITLARQVVLNLPFIRLKEKIDVLKKDIKVDCINLMHSTRESGVLVYKPLYKSSLK